MSWSWKIATIRGIGVYVHATFFILIAFVIFSHWSAGQSWDKTLEGVLFMLSLFGCVVLHEFGHALMAARFGIRTRDITLLPIGGLARLERMPEEPLQELWVALAGPAVNVVIATVLGAWLVFSSSFTPLEELTVAGGPFLERLLVVNVMLVVFNMLPAFPMDGGRVLRALLATQLDYTQATQIAAATGQAMALLFGLIGFLFNPMLLFIALFVWIGAAQEASMVQIRSSLGGIPVVRAMITDYTTLAVDDPLSIAVERILAGSQQDFPVVDGEQVVGILTRHDLMAALARRGLDATVGESMQRTFETVESAEMLETAFQRMQQCTCQTAPVLRRGTLVGLLTLDNLGEFLAIRAAIDRRS